MNAQNIWAGTDYAWIPRRGRSERFSLRAHRVRVQRVLKEIQAGNAKASTFVEVQFVNKETGAVEEYSGWYGIEDKRDDPVTGKTIYKLRAYDFVEAWENIRDEYQHLARKDEERKREHEERERKAQQEREQRERERRMRLGKIQEFLTDHGVKPDWIRSISYVSSWSNEIAGIVLDPKKIEQAMNEEGVDKSNVIGFNERREVS